MRVTNVCNAAESDDPGSTTFTAQLSMIVVACSLPQLAASCAGVWMPMITCARDRIVEISFGMSFKRARLANSSRANIGRVWATSGSSTAVSATWNKWRSTAPNSASCVDCDEWSAIKNSVSDPPLEVTSTGTGATLAPALAVHFRLRVSSCAVASMEPAMRESFCPSLASWSRASLASGDSLRRSAVSLAMSANTDSFVIQPSTVDSDAPISDAIRSMSLSAACTRFGHTAWLP